MKDFFYEQKVFLLYLIGMIPSLEGWTSQVDYKSRENEIKNLTVDDIEITQEDKDIAAIQGNDIETIKIERLAAYKEQKLQELKKSFGISDEKTETKKEIKIKGQNDQRQKLWDILKGKGLL